MYGTAAVPGVSCPLTARVKGKAPCGFVAIFSDSSERLYISSLNGGEPGAAQPKTAAGRVVSENQIYFFRKDQKYPERGE